jgi:UPF0042 nucleotide-binding protein
MFKFHSKKFKSKEKKFFIITGISGAGKTKALQFFGDFGFYCVDNLPVALLKDFGKYIESARLPNVALGVDIRGGKDIKSLPALIKEFKRKDLDVKVIFLNASDAKLVQRFSETKHKHPLSTELIEAINKERHELKPLEEIADAEIDTTKTTLSELKERIGALIGVNRESDMLVRVLSFGFKHGLPLESDLVFDVRFLPNPYYEKGLKEKTGLDKDVREYLERFPETKEFLDKLYSMISYLMPKYVKEGKSYLTVSVGCTGGRHRSVYMASELAARLEKDGGTVSEYHRDLKK